MEIVTFIVFEIFALFILIPLIYGMRIYRTFSSDLRIFYLYLVVVLIEWSIGTTLALLGRNNHYVINIIAMIDLGFLLWVFSLWQKKLKIQLAIRITIILFVIVVLSELFILKNIYDFSIFSGPLEYAIFIIVSALSLYQLNTETEGVITEQPRFWISAGVLLFASGGLVVLIFSQLLLKSDQELMRNALIIQSVSSAVAYILYFVGFRCHYHFIYKANKSGGSFSSVQP
jgi:hypothetical protein